MGSLLNIRTICFGKIKATKVNTADNIASPKNPNPRNFLM